MGELREFLIQRVHDGFSFPLNPVWPVRDPGWYDVLSALRSSAASEEHLRAWYPSSANILQKIDEIHTEFPDGFRLKTLARNSENSYSQSDGSDPNNPGNSFLRGSWFSMSLGSDPANPRDSCDVDLSLH